MAGLLLSAGKKGRGHGCPALGQLEAPKLFTPGYSVPSIVRIIPDARVLRQANETTLN